MFDHFSVARLSHCVTSGPRKNYQTFTARHSGVARCRLIHGPAPVRGPGVGEHCSRGTCVKIFGNVTRNQVYKVIG
ncbi:hypothetical protein NDU88_004825 [Pleurodeles waltl]|uniref:Uncharacterized protein n=1 Tax=Pleurodeles waltl TaxID=8319 RepID=A0AAV7QJH0_PLEWA|nr:hypothetical protein NDU88_004825 [Pleurodeles waltl]